jgi:hypothetical protein
MSTGRSPAAPALDLAPARVDLAGVLGAAREQRLGAVRRFRLILELARTVQPLSAAIVRPSRSCVPMLPRLSSVLLAA